MAGLEMEGLCEKEYEQCLEQRMTLAAKKWGYQSYNHKGLNSSNNLGELESGLFPRAFR